VIFGLQARYYFPVIVLLLAFVSLGQTSKENAPQNFKFFAIVFCLVLNLGISFWQIAKAFS
jgi:hypothetical protein